MFHPPSNTFFGYTGRPGADGHLRYHVLEDRQGAMLLAPGRAGEPSRAVLPGALRLDKPLPALPGHSSRPIGSGWAGRGFSAA